MNFTHVGHAQVDQKSKINDKSHYCGIILLLEILIQGLKSWKHDFEIAGDPKGTPSGSTFWSGFEGPDS